MQTLESVRNSFLELAPSQNGNYATVYESDVNQHGDIRARYGIPDVGKFQHMRKQCLPSLAEGLGTTGIIYRGENMEIHGISGISNFVGVGGYR